MTVSNSELIPCLAAAHEAALAVCAEEGSWLPLLPVNAYGEQRPLEWLTESRTAYQQRLHTL